MVRVTVTREEAEDGLPRINAMEELVKPEQAMAGAHSEFFGGKEIDLKTDLTEDLALALAEAEVLIVKIESRDLAVLVDSIQRKRVSLRRSSRKEWVRIGTAVTREDDKKVERGVR